MIYKIMRSGIIAVDKPAGISSARLVARVKRALDVKKAGHTGTLDPFATGLMLCGINQGTRISRFLLGGPKRYRAVLHLGVETDTLDSTGRVIRSVDDAALKKVTPELIVETAASFCGLQDQRPPVYSALKHKGKPLYRLAREGKAVEKPPRPIEIFDIAVIRVAMPFVTLDVRCSAGTYIRSLARDIGEKLGCLGHLSGLERTESCGFTLADAVSLLELEAMDKTAARLHLIAMADCLPFMPRFFASDQLLNTVRFGQKLSAAAIPDPSFKKEGTFIRILDKEGGLAAVVAYDKTRDSYNYCCVFLN